jgi:glycosyltransferase involved in cell wall biosynthesis
MKYKSDTLVILSPGFPKNEDDTTCLPLQQVLVKELKRNYPDINIIVLAFQYPFKKHNYVWNGVTIKAFGGKGRGKLFRFLNWISVWRELKRLNKSHHIIGLFSFWMGECSFIGHWFAKAYYLKHSCWICGQDAKAGNVYLKMMQPDANELVALSDFLVKTVWDNYTIKPAHMIPGGIDTDMFGAGYTSRPIDILSAGSLITLKQFNLFIEVVARVKKTFPNVNAVLCGDGPERDSLLLMIKKLGLEKNITLTGELPHTEVLDLMQQAKVFFHPSNYEGLGMVMVEALYAGAKVISFVKPFNREISNWHVVERTLPASNLILDILHNDAEQFTSVTPFTIADTAEAIVKLYDNSIVPISRKRRAMALKESVA